MQHCDVESDGTLVLGLNFTAAVGSVVVHGEGECVLMFMCTYVIVIVYHHPQISLHHYIFLNCQDTMHVPKDLITNIVCACGNGRMCL